MRNIIPFLFAIFLLAASLPVEPLRASSDALEDGPGAGGGYKPQTLALEDGPGSGGGYKPQALALDDGPGAGGGYCFVKDETVAEVHSDRFPWSAAFRS